MRNILKSFMRPQVDTYVFPEADDIVLGEQPPVEESPPPPPGPLQEDDAPDAVRDPEPSPSAIGPKSPIDFAKIQAEAILEDARQQAREILDTALTQAAADIDRACQEGRDNGYRAGYAEGLTKAEAEAKMHREAQATELENQIRSFLEDASAARERMMASAADELRDLSISIAEKIVRVSLKSSSEIIGRMIQAATEKLRRREWVHIYIAGCDAKGMAQVSPALSASLSALSEHVKIIPMADDESGTCIIEMPDQIIDASVSTQLSNIRDALADVPYDTP